LNDFVTHLPMLKDSNKVVSTMKKGNVPFGEADLAAIVLASVPMAWHNQYNLTHLTVPKLTRALLLDLEASERVMVEKQNEKLKAKGKAASAYPEAKSNPMRKASGGLTGQAPKKGHSEKFCQRCKAHVGPYQTHTTLDCRPYDSNGSPLRQQQGSPLSPRSPTRSLGVRRAWPSCRPS
jgi:hypothetical protein